MKEIEKIDFENKSKLYNYLNMKLTGLICEENDWLANLANASALLWMLLDEINWAGFYLYKNEELVLGPFQGKPACTHIAIGRGVCGTAVATRATQLVRDVHDFPGHIACDSDSNSEMVIPIIIGDKIIGVLDIDSPIVNRFDNEDKKYIEKFVEILIKYVAFPDEFI
nr:GAF domain-containing protein [Sedimentibacter sp.]